MQIERMHLPSAMAGRYRRFRDSGAKVLMMRVCTPTSPSAAMAVT